MVRRRSCTIFEAGRRTKQAGSKRRIALGGWGAQGDPTLEYPSRGGAAAGGSTLPGVRRRFLIPLLVRRNGA